MTTEKQRFNVGDVVINLKDISFWNNCYHFENFIRSLKKEVVTQAQQYKFTTLDNINLNSYEDCGKHDNSYYIYDQRTGVGASGFKQVHNWTTNEKNIRAYIQKQFDEALAKCTKEDEEAIAQLEADIRHKQAKIDAIKAGNRPISFNSNINEREFLNARIQDITKILDSF